LHNSENCQTLDYLTLKTLKLSSKRKLFKKVKGKNKSYKATYFVYYI